MATASANPMDMIGKELTCSICLNLLKEPKDLDCPHTYCLGCLKEYVQKEPTIECPECRYITIVPQGGLANLKTNLCLKNTIETFIKETGLRSNKRQKLMEVPECPNHIGERQHFFCVTCSVAVCHNCVVLKHPKPQHEIRELKDDSGEDKKQKKKQELEDVKRKLKSSKDKAEQEVKSHVKDLTAKLKTWETKVNTDIQTIYQTRINILQKKASSQKDEALSHDISVLHFEPGRVKSSSFGKLVTSDNNNFTFTNQMLAGSTRLGKLVTPGNNKPATSTTNQMLAGSSNKELNLTNLTEFSDFGNPSCFAANHSNLIAIGDNWAPHVIIYGKGNGDLNRQCQLKLVNRPNSVAISSRGKFFVSDGGVVKVFSSAGEYERSWPKTVYEDVITITPFDMVVIRSKPAGVITVYQSDGKLVKRHFRQVGVGINRIASNGTHIAFTKRDTVCVIDFVTGERLWTLPMSKPLGICYEQNSNTLLVSRGSYRSPGQGVIEQYCSTTGRLISRLASGLHYPWGMTVTQDNKLLLADCKSFKIYNIKVAGEELKSF